MKDLILHQKDRVDSCLNISIEEIKSEIQTAKDYMKVQILSQEDIIEHHDTYKNNSVEEIKSQIQRSSNGAKGQFSRLENRVERKRKCIETVTDRSC